MSWKKSFTTVTPFSKFVALSLFVLLPALTFLIGIQYGLKMGYLVRVTWEQNQVIMNPTPTPVKMMLKKVK